jgi:hypothetical protein
VVTSVTLLRRNQTQIPCFVNACELLLENLIGAICVAYGFGNSSNAVPCTGCWSHQGLLQEPSRYGHVCIMHTMRRFIALIIMLVVPLQFVWAAAAGLHGHAGMDVATSGFHTHDHDHRDSVHAAGHDFTGDTNNQDHNEDGHHGHYHPVFTSILTESSLVLDIALPGGPILYPHSAFFSRIPPLLDRPPLARA